MKHLFQPMTLRSVTMRNRIGLSPMCTYSAREGRVSEWHIAHLGARAMGGAGLVIAEASAVVPEGRISPADTGLWSYNQIAPWSVVTSFIERQGAVPAVQLAHGGRKAGGFPPWIGRGQVPLDQGGWQARGPCDEPFQEGQRPPLALTAAELPDLARRWAEAATRAHMAGFRLIEIHMAHGYLLHEFLSPLVNRRDDEYGGSLENRMRFPLQVARAVREAWPEDLPLLVRISATDWVPEGWDIGQSIVLCRELKALGVDLIDCSSGGAVPGHRNPAAPGFQVPFASRIRQEVGIPTAAVGLITEPEQAEKILSEGRADLILIGRAMLRDSIWPHRAAEALGVEPDWPVQYGWALS